MSNPRTLFASLFMLVAGLLTGCSTGPYSKPYFATAEKDGKLYVFYHGTDEWKHFQETGKIEKPVVAPKAGPNGMTVLAPSEQILDNYLR